MRGAQFFILKLASISLPKFPDGRELWDDFAGSFAVIAQGKRHNDPRAAGLRSFNPLRAAQRANAFINAEQSHAGRNAFRKADPIVLDGDFEVRRRVPFGIIKFGRRVQSEFQNGFAPARA
jgi:hypothetical protein